MLEESSLLKPEDVCVHFARYQHSSLPSAEQRAAPVVFLHAVPSSVCKLAAAVCALYIAELQGSALRETQCSQYCSDSVPMPGKKKCAGEYLASVSAILSISEHSRENTNSLLLPCFFFATPLLQSPTHVRLRRAISLWTCESVILHSGRSCSCLCLCAGRDRRLRPYPCGLILSTGALPILNLLLSWCRRCARSCTVQVPSEQPCLLDWLAEFFDLLVRTLMSVLEDREGDKRTLIDAVRSQVVNGWVFLLHERI